MAKCRDIKLGIIFESGARIGPGKAMPLAPGSDRLASHGPRPSEGGRPR